MIEHQILVSDPTPISLPQYRTSFALKEEMKSQAENMLRKEAIRKSYSPWPAPEILSQEEPGRETKVQILCRLSRTQRSDQVWLLSSRPFCRQYLKHIWLQILFVLDCCSGFCRINICKEHKQVKGYTVPSGHYEFNSLPFVLCNSLANFQRLMDVVLKDLAGTDCFVFRWYFSVV